MRSWLRSAYGKKGSSRNLEERRKGIVYTLNISTPTAFGFGILNYIQGHHVLGLILLATVLQLLLPIYYLRRQENLLSFCEYTLMLAALLVFSSLLIDGGLARTGIYWVPVYPFLAFYVMGQREGWYWIALFLTLILASFGLHKAAYIDLHYSGEELQYFFCAFLFFSLIACIFNMLRNSYEEELEATVQKRTAEATSYLKKLEHQALFDPLTDLPNRFMFQDRLQAILSANRPHSLTVAVLCLDRFQEINDILGHDNGDRLLKGLGRRLNRVMHNAGMAARIGGDEFAVLLVPKNDSDHRHVMAELQQELNKPFRLDGSNIEVGAHIGIATYPEHGDEATILLQRADVAMRLCKRALVAVRKYDAAQDPYSLRHLIMFGKLRKAIDAGALTLHYQPKVNMQTARITDVEALCRWQDGKKASVSPAEFIPLAEQTSLIAPLTMWVLDEAIRQCSAWNRAGWGIGVAANLSARNLLDPDLPGWVAGALKTHGLDVCNLTLEVTESAIMQHPDKALAVLSALRKMGIRLSIDDFGTGYSSLAYLKQLPVNELKIDQSFIFPMLESSRDQMIIRSATDLAHGFDLKVIAEGVESAAIWKRLTAYGVDKAQGFYMGRPMSAAELEVWLQESPWGLAAQRDNNN